MEGIQSYFVELLDRVTDLILPVSSSATCYQIDDHLFVFLNLCFVQIAGVQCTCNTELVSAKFF